MSFKTVWQRHEQKADVDLKPRQRALNLRLSLLNGTFYDVQPNQDFDAVWQNGRYVVPFDRRPHMPLGTNEIRIQMERQAQMSFGAKHFPTVETPDPITRKALADWIDEANLAERFTRAVKLGSAGSVCLIFKVRADDDTDACRVFVDVMSTENLTVEFDPNRPDMAKVVTELRKVIGADLAEVGYDIPADNQAKWYWFKREFTKDAETWYVPWLVADEQRLRQNREWHGPTVDEKRSVKHTFFNRCPAIWIKNLYEGDDLEGICSFEDALDPAVTLDFLESLIVSANVYTTAPQAVIKTKAPTPGAGGDTEENQADASDGGSGIIMTHASVLTIDSEADAFFLEIKGDGLERSKDNAKDILSKIIKAVHGDLVDPKEVTQGHQGSKSLELLNQALLERIGAIQTCYGNALKKLLRMFIEVATKQTVLVNDKPVELGATDDLTLRWSGFYSMTAQEKLAEAQAHNQLIVAGIESRENATKDMATDLHIVDVAAEQALIAKDRSDDVAQAKLMAEATAQQNQV